MNEIAFSDYHEAVARELRAAVRRYYDLWEEILDKEESERVSWTWRIEQPRVSIIVLSCVLAEYAINFYIATQCDDRKFEKLDRKALFTKWAEVPQLFIKTYNFPTALHSDLSNLIARRNAIVHAKPMMSIDGDNRHKGNEPRIVLDEHEFMGRCCTLPFRLVEHLRSFERESFMLLDHVRTYCGHAANEFEAGQRRLDVVSQYPPETIREIMQQGYDRRTAVRCAIFMGDIPKVDEAGHIVIRRGKVITLKPLKFFAAKNGLPM